MRRQGEATESASMGGGDTQRQAEAAKVKRRAEETTKVQHVSFEP